MFEEVQKCQDASVKTTRETRLPCTLALVLAGAHTSELPYVTADDAFPEHGLVWAHGTGATTTARWLVLDEWGTEQVARRLDWLAANPEHDDGTRDRRGLVYTPRSLGVPHHIRCGAGSVMMSEVIRRAGLAGDPGFRPLSLQEYLAQRVYEQTGSVEKVAVRLGMRSLDSVVDLLDLDWREGHEVPGPPGVHRTAEDNTHGRRRAPEDKP